MVRIAGCRPMRVIDRGRVPGRAFRGDASLSAWSWSLIWVKMRLRSSDFAAIPIAREAVTGIEGIADRLQMFHVKLQSTLFTSPVSGRSSTGNGCRSNPRLSFGRQIWCGMLTCNCPARLRRHKPWAWTAKLLAIEPQAGSITTRASKRQENSRSSTRPDVCSWAWEASWQNL